MNRFFSVTALLIALLASLISLTVSAGLFYGAVRLRTAGLESLAQARTALSTLSEYTIDTTLPFQQTFPIHTTVPFQEEFHVPIQTTVPISTVVEIPVQIPVLGTYQVAIPVQTDIPVNVEVTIPISQAVEIDTEVTVDTQVPVHIEVGQLGLDEILGQIDSMLAEIEEGLRWPAPSTGQ